MAKQVYFQNDNIIQEYDLEKSIYQATFISSEHLSIEEWIEIAKRVEEIIEKHQLNYMIDDFRTSESTIPIEIQEWVAINLVPRLMKNKVKKYAQIVGHSFFVEISGQQLVEEAQKQHPDLFETRFFDNMEDAIKWVSE